MSDLVKRLRKMRLLGGWDGDLLRDAADEIERLRAENKKLRDAIGWVCTDSAYKAPEQVTVDLLTGYIGRLRDALKEVGP